MTNSGYDSDDYILLRNELYDRVNEEYSKRSEVDLTIKDIDKQLDMIKQYGIYIFNHELINLYEHLKKKFNVMRGPEYLKDLSADERVATLNAYGFLQYAIMLPYILGEDVLNNGAKKVGVNGFRGIVERDMLSSNQVDSGQILLF